MTNLLTSLTLSQELFDLGFRKESCFYWKVDNDKPYIVARDSRYYTSKGKILCSAYLAGELAEWLPEKVSGDEMNFDLDIFKMKNWNVAYWWDEDTRRKSDFHYPISVAPTLCDAMAGMLVYLIKQKIIKP